MAKRAGKQNPYVHSDESKGMLNQADNNGWGFDEREDDGPAPEVVTVEQREVERRAAAVEDNVTAHRMQLAQEYLNLSQEDAAQMSDEALSDRALAAQEMVEDLRFFTDLSSSMGPGI